MKNLFSIALFALVAFTFSAFRSTPEFAPQPDLVVKEVIDNCQVPELFIVVKNVGTAISGATTGNLFPQDSQAKICLKDRTFKIPRLKPGESVRIRVLLALEKGCFCQGGNTVIAGGMDYKIVVDTPNTVAESDEGNNSFAYHYD